MEKADHLHVMSQALTQLLFATLVSSCVGASSGTTISMPQNVEQVYAMLHLGLKSGIIGGVLLVVGLLLCLSGKKFFKLFLSVVGFVAGATLGFIIMASAARNPLFTIPNQEIVTYVVAGILGVILAAVCLYLWKIGVYIGAGLGGFSLATFILSLKLGEYIEPQIGRQAILAIGAGLGVVAAILFEDMAIAVASSLAGSLMAMCGLDCYLQTGFWAQVYDQAIAKTFILPDPTSKMYYMFAGTICLAVLGIVVQLLAPSKGFGRHG